MAEVLRACEITHSGRYWDSLGGVPTEAQRKVAEADPRNPQSTLGNQETVLAGGEPNNVRSAARFCLRQSRLRSARCHYPAASAMDNASRAPSSSARQHMISQDPTASGLPLAKPSAALL